MRSKNRHKLLVPGPVSVKRAVLNKMAQDIRFHRSDDFRILHKSVRELALKAFGADKYHDIILFTASGTMALEASILSFIGKEEKILVVNNGHFASRIEKILKTNGFEFETFKSAWQKPIDYAALKKTVQAVKPNFILAVALETSTGSFNSTKSIGNIAKENNCKFFVDAVSGYFAEDIDVNRDSIDICVTVSNKALEAPSGMSFIYFKKCLLKDRGPIPITLDLNNAHESGKKNETPFTPNIPIFKAVEAALIEFNQETRNGRAARYTALSEQVRNRLEKIGAIYYLQDKEMFAKAITSISLPIERAEAIGNKMRESGFTVWYKHYLEQPEEDVAIFQISVMGDVSGDDIDRFLKEFEIVYEKK
jgi:2-aminoethylphosphonate-pyruvate transaminase